MKFLMRYARAALVVGIGLLGFAVYAFWLSFGGHAYASREKLTPLQVYVNSAAHVTVKKRKRSIARSEYYVLEVSMRDRVEQKELRMDIGLPEEIVAALIEEKVNVLVDEDNNLLLYEASVLGDDDQEYLLLSYEQTRDLLQKKAEERANNPAGIGAGVLLTVLGVFGIRQRRKQRQQQAAEEKAEAST